MYPFGEGGRHCAARKEYVQETSIHCQGQTIQISHISGFLTKFWRHHAKLGKQPPPHKLMRQYGLGKARLGIPLATWCAWERDRNIPFHIGQNSWNWFCSLLPNEKYYIHTLRCAPYTFNVHPLSFSCVEKKEHLYSKTHSLKYMSSTIWLQLPLEDRENWRLMAPCSICFICKYTTRA